RADGDSDHERGGVGQRQIATQLEHGGAHTAIVQSRGRSHGGKAMAEHEYRATIHWTRGTAVFTDKRYSRGHTWRFDGGLEAPAVMGKNAAGRIAMVRVSLTPRVAFSGERLPARAQILELHTRAHEECYIANSVTTDVRCEPVFDA